MFPVYADGTIENLKPPRNNLRQSGRANCPLLLTGENTAFLRFEGARFRHRPWLRTGRVAQGSVRLRTGRGLWVSRGSCASTRAPSLSIPAQCPVEAVPALDLGQPHENGLPMQNSLNFGCSGGYPTYLPILKPLRAMARDGADRSQTDKVCCAFRSDRRPVWHSVR